MAPIGISWCLVVACVLVLNFPAGEAQTGFGTLGNEYGGSCGYTNFPSNSTPVTGFSTAIYYAGGVCGGCYEVQCFGTATCVPGASVIVTATNECVADKFNSTDPCRPPNAALNLQPTAFDRISKSRGPGIVNVAWKPVRCVRKAGVQFKVTVGNAYYMSVVVQNVAGPGALRAVSIQAGDGPLVPMSRSFGAVWLVTNLEVQNKPITFLLTGYNGEKLLVPNALPETWVAQKVYTSTVNYDMPVKPAAKKAVVKKA